MSNGELLDVVKFGWITRIWLDCMDIHKLPRYYLKQQNITQNCPKRQNIAQILHKITQVLRARPTQGIAHSTIAITLPLIVSRKGWLTQPSPSPPPLFYSLYPVGAAL